MTELSKLEAICRLVRRSILTSTSRAGSGHPTSSLSAVELMAVLFFDGQPAGGFFRQDSTYPQSPNNDRFILSKGHAAPLLYSLYYAAGKISEEELLTLRQFGSRLEGHPTPRFPYADVATGSLGQGLSVGLGMALAMRLEQTVEGRKLKIDSQPSNFQPQNKLSTVYHQPSILPFVFVLMGDSEMAEGQVWEAMELASYYKINNLIAMVDVNRLGQRGETMLGWDLETYQKRAESFGWEAHVIEDGHDIEEIRNVYSHILTVEDRRLKVENEDRSLKIDKNQPSSINHQDQPSTIYQLPSSNNRPKIIFAKTIKGKGVSFLENKNGWHGKTLDPEELEKALEEIGQADKNIIGTIQKPKQLQSVAISGQLESVTQKLASFQTDFNRSPIKTDYKLGDLVSTRKAYGQGLLEVGKENPSVVALDAELSTSTFASIFKEAFPDRFFEMFIAEQNMVSTAVGLSVFGFIPFVSTFGAFLTRAYDQIRMASYSQANIKLVGSHVGISMGQDGPSQMGLEDIAMMRTIQGSTVLYPSDAVSTRKLVKEMSLHKGIDYLRTTRAETPVIYDESEEFPIGGLKILRQSDKDVAVVIGAGITVHEALKAYEELKKKDIFITVVDLYSIKPLDVSTLKRLITYTPGVSSLVVVEDHYAEGGIGEAISSVLLHHLSSINYQLIHLAVRKQPRSGKPDELLRYEEIDARAIVDLVLQLQNGTR